MKILLVIDMQNDFIDGSLGTKEAVDILKSVKKKIETFDGKVFYTQDTHFEDYLETQEGKKLPVIHCIKGSEGWKIHDEIYDGKSEIIEKNTFGSLELVDKIKKLNDTEKIDSIELIGLCTDICVITNAMLVKTALPEVPVIIDSNCCAGVTKSSHKNALDAMKMCQIEVIE